MTASYYKLLDGVERKAIASGGQPGDAAWWKNLVKQRDGYYVRIDFAYVVTEAGVTPTSEVVRVASWLGQIVDGNDEPINMQDTPSIVDCSMLKVNGQWKVAGLQQPAG